MCVHVCGGCLVYLCYAIWKGKYEEYSKDNQLHNSYVDTPFLTVADYHILIFCEMIFSSKHIYYNSFYYSKL